jgi:hypothetical protein
VIARMQELSAQYPRYGYRRSKGGLPKQRRGRLPGRRRRHWSFGPFKRTQVRWSAIISNPADQFAVEDGPQGRVLPSGDARPGYPIPELCRRDLGLHPFEFVTAPPLRLVGIVGRGQESVTMYFAGEVTSGAALVKRFGASLSFVDRGLLRSFLPLKSKKTSAIE